MENLGSPYFFISIANIWLAGGVSLIAVEALGFPGVGFLFSGLGALIVGGCIYLGVIDSGAYIAQFTLFFISTAVWAVALWKPIKKFRLGKQGDEYSNIVGESAYVGSGGLHKISGGEVTWSGTIMRAQLAKNIAQDTLEAGSQVEIVGVAGATLIVKPKE